MKRILFYILVSVVVLAVVGYTVNAIQRQAYLREVERVNIIRLQGPVEQSASVLGSVQSITPRMVEERLRRAAEDISIKGVVLRIDSPGGSVAASQEIADLIRGFEKPLVVSMGDMVVSGGYYISSPAEGIVAQPGTMTGSIGVIMMTVDIGGFLENIGIEMEVIKSGEHKDLFQRDLEPEERQILQDISDEAYNQFIDEVARGRELERSEVEELATGQIYTGSQAHRLGLVDRMGGIDEAVEYVAEIGGLEDPVPYEYPAPGFLSRLTGLGVSLPRILETMRLPTELQILEGMRRSLPHLPRYELR